MKRSEEKLNEWRLLFEERKEKGIAVKEFCKEKNVTPAQFYYYQDIITQPDKSQAPVKKKKIQQPFTTDMKAIKVVNPVGRETFSIRFILPNSLQCILPRDISIVEMKAILEMLMSC